MAEAHPARSVLVDDLKNVEFETSEDVEVLPTFDALHLKEDLLRGVYAYGILIFKLICKSRALGFERPSVI